MYSLITTVFNEEDSIVDFIKSLNNQSVYPNEVIVLDGGSKDKTVSLIKKTISEEINLKIIIDETCNKKFYKGPIARGRNIAIKNSTFTTILVTDAGCVLDTNWVEEMIKSFENRGAEIVSGWYKPLIKNNFQQEIASIFCPPLKEINHKKFLPSSRSLGFKKWIWEKVDGYPEDSYTGEDTLFDLKIFKITDKVIFNPEAFVFWEVPKNKEELNNKLFNYGYGEGQLKIFIGKNLLRGLLLIFFPILLILILFKIKNKFVFRFYFYQFKGFISGILNIK